MYIKFDTFSEFLKAASKIKAVSPGGVARDFGVSRQTVANWINKDVVDAYIYKDEVAGIYSVLNLDDYPKIREYRKKVSRYLIK